MQATDSQSNARRRCFASEARPSLGSARTGGVPSERATEGLGRFVVVFFSIVVVAAGVSGAALMVAPGSTERYFSWTLRPPAAAALIGGFYLASAAVFAWALTLPWRQARSLVVGVLGLAVPTLVMTLVHDEVFDFGRWQALLWVGLFVTAPVTASALLTVQRGVETGGPALGAGSRVGLGLLASVLGVLAVLIWFDATRDDVARLGPVDLVRLTGAYIGAWCSFLAVLCGWAAALGTWDAARVPLMTVSAAAGGALIAFLRSIADLSRPVLTVVVTSILLTGAAAAYRRNRPGRSSDPGVGDLPVA